MKGLPGRDDIGLELLVKAGAVLSNTREVDRAHFAELRDRVVYERPEQHRHGEDERADEVSNDAQDSWYDDRARRERFEMVREHEMGQLVR